MDSPVDRVLLRPAVAPAARIANPALPTPPPAPGGEVDVEVLMRHVHRQLTRAAERAAAPGAASNPLWTSVGVEWEALSRHLWDAAGAGDLDGALRRLPSFPHLARILRPLGLWLVKPLIRVPCLLMMRVLLPTLHNLAQHQNLLNQALVGSSQGVAHRLMECEEALRHQAERLAVLERRLADQAPPEPLRRRA